MVGQPDLALLQKFGFPRLTASDFRFASRYSPVHNRIAWAAGKPLPFFWPSGARAPYWRER